VFRYTYNEYTAEPDRNYWDDAYLVANSAATFLNATSICPHFPYETCDLSVIILHDYELQVLICRILRSLSVQLTSMRE
jgi:hypothetical protein